MRAMKQQQVCNSLFVDLIYKYLFRSSGVFAFEIKSNTQNIYALCVWLLFVNDCMILVSNKVQWITYKVKLRVKRMKQIHANS